LIPCLFPHRVVVLYGREEGREGGREGEREGGREREGGHCDLEPS